MFRVREGTEEPKPEQQLLDAGPSGPGCFAFPAPSGHCPGKPRASPLGLVSVAPPTAPRATAPARFSQVSGPAPLELHHQPHTPPPLLHPHRWGLGGICPGGAPAHNLENWQEIPSPGRAPSHTPPHSSPSPSGRPLLTGLSSETPLGCGRRRGVPGVCCPSLGPLFHLCLTEH